MDTTTIKVGVMDNVIRVAGMILTRRKARKTHRCAVCKYGIPAGTYYYDEVIGGGGLRSITMPDRLHESCVILRYKEVA